jgi:hypothetical protein
MTEGKPRVILYTRRRKPVPRAHRSRSEDHKNGFIRKKKWLDYLTVL